MNWFYRKKKTASEKKTKEQPSQEKPAGNTEDEFSDIMSQYLLQADQGIILSWLQGYMCCLMCLFLGIA